MNKLDGCYFQIRETLSLELSRFLILFYNQGGSSFLDRVSKLSYRVLEPLPRQLLGTLKPSMVALRLLPAGKGTSKRLGSNSLVVRAAPKQFFREIPFNVLVGLEAGV